MEDIVPHEWKSGDVVKILSNSNTWLYFVVSPMLALIKTFFFLINFGSVRQIVKFKEEIDNDFELLRMQPRRNVTRLGGTQG